LALMRAASAFGSAAGGADAAPSAGGAPSAAAAGGAAAAARASSTLALSVIQSWSSTFVPVTRTTSPSNVRYSTIVGLSGAAAAGATSSRLSSRSELPMTFATPGYESSRPFGTPATS